MTRPLPLPAIAALARSGATAHAWDLLHDGGWLTGGGDAAALSLKGRLLKDQARMARGAARQELFAKAAEAYQAADRLAPAPYRAVNAATARLLAGDPAGAMAGAEAVLTTLDAAVAPADTPYYLAATRAEAALLLGRTAAAEAAMADAVLADPDGWEDRAVTLRQLREIVAAQGGDAGWLEAFAPPACLHFAGHLGIAEGGDGEHRVAAATDAIIRDRRVGFGWGALAAGADIVIAERLVKAGAELHVVLPCPPSEFARQSITPAGNGWLARYEALLAAASSLRIAAHCRAPVHDPLATAHAGTLAIGATLLQATRLGTATLQWLVEDEDGGGANTRRQALLWPVEAGEQVHLQVARDTSVEALFPPEAPDPARRLVWELAIAALPAPDGSSGDEIATHYGPVAQAIAASGLPPRRVRAATGRWDLLCDSPEEVGRLLDAFGVVPVPAVAIGVHVSIGRVILDPASQSEVAFGADTERVSQMLAMAPGGTALCSDDVAVALAGMGGTGLRTQLYHTGDAESGGPVHLLSVAVQ